tara:strand:+ start:450 stop:707 length:258 start_codon:yes stop_codon:yes gene_type:complete
MKFRKKPVVIEAIQISADNIDEVGEFFGNPRTERPFGWHGDHWSIITLEGVMDGNIGDWVIKGVKGEFYPCKPDIFTETYEPIEA